MSNKTAKKKAKPAVVAFELPDGIDASLQVIPAELLSAIVDTLDNVPAKLSRNILNALQNAIAQKQVTNIGEYLKDLHDAKA